MVTSDGKLLIFENFEVNLELPKWNKRQEAHESDGDSMVMRPGRTRRSRMLTSEEWENTTETGTTWFGNGPVTDISVDSSTSSIITATTFPVTIRTTSYGNFIDASFQEPWRKRWGKKLKALFTKKQKPEPQKPAPKTVQVNEVVTQYTIEDFFKELKARGQSLKIVNDRIKDFEKVLEYVRSTHQKALQERLEETIELVRSETNLVSLGLKTVIPEHMVVTFHKKCTEGDKRGLKLDWIKNFARLIPEKLVTLKNKCDELEVFDNYVILHYDPKNKGTLETKEEIRKKKDPILFGVISGSRNLYYIGDWIDQYCDLTLRAFIEEFGKEGVKANDIHTHIKVEDFVVLPEAAEPT